MKYYINFTILLFFGLVTGGFLLLGAPRGLIAWGATLGLLIVFCYSFSQLSGNRSELTTVVVISYLFISLIGLVEVGDNLRNFGTYFGKHADDSRFFERTMALLQRGEWQDRTGMYEVCMALWGVIPALVFGISMSPIDFLPFNWGLAALVAGLIWVFCQIALGIRPPWWIILLATLGNYRFMDSVIHLYREALLLVFFMLALIAIVQDRHLKSMILAGAVLLLRGASFILCAGFSALFLLRRRMRSPLAFYTLCIVLVVPISFLALKSGTTILMYSSGITQAGGTVGLESWSFSENRSFRAQMIAKQVTDGSTTAAIISGGGLVATLARPVPYLFFPIRFWPVHMVQDSHSVFANTAAYQAGEYWINVYVGWTVCCWLIVIPLLTVGMLKAAAGRPLENVIFVFYILAVVATSYISFQMRHGLVFIVLNPLLATIGLREYYADKTTRAVTWGLGGVVFLSLLFYNAIEGAVL